MDEVVDISSLRDSPISSSGSGTTQENTQLPFHQSPRDTLHAGKRMHRIPAGVRKEVSRPAATSEPEAVVKPGRLWRDACGDAKDPQG